MKSFPKSRSFIDENFLIIEPSEKIKIVVARLRIVRSSKAFNIVSKLYKVI